MPKTSFIPALKFKWMTIFFDPFLKLTMREKEIKLELILQADLKSNEKILDFGCGTGTLILMIKKAIPGVIVHGLDIDTKILRISEEKIGKSGHKIPLNEYNGDVFPYESEMFDKVLSSLVFHHLNSEQKVKVLEEIYRVLKKGGEFHMADFGKAKNAWMRILFFIAQLAEGFKSTNDNVKGLLPGFMQKAGFTDVKETRVFTTIFGNLSLYKTIKR